MQHIKTYGIGREIWKMDNQYICYGVVENSGFLRAITEDTLEKAEEHYTKLYARIRKNLEKDEEPAVREVAKLSNEQIETFRRILG